MSDFWVDLGYYVLMGLVYLAAVIVICIRNKITKKISVAKAEQKIEEEATLKAARIKMVKVAINQFIKDAERMKHYTGEEKKNFVFTRAIQIANGVLTNAEIDAYIEEQVALTDNVNKHN